MSRSESIQRLFASVLLATFVLGGLVAPVAHFGWMALSDRFDMAAHGSDHAMAATDAVMPAHHTGSPHETAPRLSGTPDPVVVCAYAQLLSQQLSVCLTDQEGIMVAGLRQVDHPAPNAPWLSADAARLEPARGPPARA